MMSMLGAFLIVSLVPTLLGLWFLRRHERFWNAVAVTSLVFAGAGLLAVLMPLVFHTSSRHITILLVGLLGLSQLPGAPRGSLACGARRELQCLNAPYD